MRSAYSGRAATYEKKNDYEKAVGDRTMVVLLLGIELEILNEQATADRDKIMLEAGQAYRDRSAALKALGRSDAAQSDIKRAEQLEQEARKLSEGQIELINRWTGPITVVVDGVSYRVDVGESKFISKRAGPFRYELPSTGQVSNGTVEGGKTFRIQIK